MTEKEIENQLINSFKKCETKEEAILDAAFYITMEFSRLKEEIKDLKNKLQKYEETIY